MPSNSRVATATVIAALWLIEPAIPDGITGAPDCRTSNGTLPV